MKKIEIYFKSLEKEIRQWIKPFLIIFCIYFIGVLAIIRANFNYIDDMARINQGYKGWDNFSRFISNFLSYFIHVDNYLTDVSPLTQIIAIIILSISAIILLYIWSSKKIFTVWQYVAIIPLGLSPYFLECISYKYDSPYMAISIFASIMPLLFRKKNMFFYGIMSAVGILIVCMTYQAASGIFPMIVVVLALKEWSQNDDKKHVLQYWITSVAGYLAGLIIFKQFIMKPADTYVSNSMSLGNALEHLKKYYQLVNFDFKTGWLILIAIIALAFIVALVISSEKNRLITLIFSILALGTAFVMAFGIYPVLESPLLAPRAMYGFGVLISIMMVEVASENRIYWGKVASLILSWAFFVFAFTYGNALYVQAEYTDYRITMVAEDLNEIMNGMSQDSKEVQIIGSIGYAPAIRNMPQDYQMLNRLIPITFIEGWHWGAYGFLNYYGLQNVTMNLGSDFPDLDLPLLKDTSMYTIKGDDTYILVELK